MLVFAGSRRQILLVLWIVLFDHRSHLAIAGEAGCRNSFPGDLLGDAALFAGVAGVKRHGAAFADALLQFFDEIIESVAGPTCLGRRAADPVLDAVLLILLVQFIFLIR